MARGERGAPFLLGMERGGAGGGAGRPRGAGCASARVGRAAGSQALQHPGGAIGQVGPSERKPGPREAARAAFLLPGIYRRGDANGSRSKQSASHRPPARAGVWSEGRRRRRRDQGL